MLANQNLTVQIKGIREGLLITLGKGEWAETSGELLKHVEEQAGFLQGARVALDVGDVTLHATDLGSLRDKLSDFQISLWAVLSNSPVTENTAQMLGLATRLASSHKPERTSNASENQMATESAVLIERTLRSGFRISHQGHITVIGDVNPGAEIIASGSIVVWGRLRGLVHAGANGNEQAVVCALDLIPTQLRIADLIAVTPQRKDKPQPEVARVQDGQVIAEPWLYR